VVVAAPWADPIFPQCMRSRSKGLRGHLPTCDRQNARSIEVLVDPEHLPELL
jgi:hypothetical protein